MNIYKKKAISSMLCSVMVGAAYLPAYAETDTFDLPEVIVVAEQAKKPLPGGFYNDKARIGILEDQDIMESPFTAQSISSKTITSMAIPNQAIDNVLSNIPAIRTGTSPIKTDFSIRGIYANASLYYLNNVPGFFIMASGPMTNIIESADVLIGPSATLNGSLQSYNGPDAGVPGAIYLQTKRPAYEDITSYTQTMGGYGSWGESIDVSRRFGKQNEWGVRIYGQYDEGGLPIDGAKAKKRNLFIDLSHASASTKTNIFGGHFDDKLWGTERRFSLPRSSSFFPKAPDAETSYDDPSAMYSFTNGYMFTLNHEKEINDNLTWFVNGGVNQTSIRRYIYNSQIQIDQAGNISGTPWSQYIFLQNQYLQTGLKRKFETGIMKHNLSFAVDRSYREMYNNSKTAPQAFITGNMYTGLIIDPQLYSFDVAQQLNKKFMYSEMDVSINIADNIKVGKWNLMAAGTRRHGSYISQKAANNIKDDNFSPTYGVSYQPTDALSFYAARAEALTRGSAVQDGYDNAGDFLAPLKTQQNEFGVKYKFDNMFVTVSYFDMIQPNYIDVVSSGTFGKSYAMDGENRYKGTELSITGQIATKWNLFGGTQYLDAKQRKTAGGKNDGMPTDGSSRWSGILGLEYKPSENTSIMGRMNYVGTGSFVASNRRVLDIPSHTTFDIFTSYKTTIGNQPVKFNAICYNVTNDSHWVAQAGQGNKFMLSMPRSFMLSAQFDL
jgi:outer membrane receptor protein involved in Fe transport